MTNAIVKQFARQVLGCDCPDEVFEEITWERDLPSPAGGGDLGVAVRLDVGHRLLVHVVVADQTSTLQRGFPALVRAGIAERDAGGYNRVRFVVATPRHQFVGPVAERLFAQQPGRDAKVHLHVLDVASVPFL